MKKIASFEMDHTRLLPGLYLSRRDGDAVTYDLRFKRPNTGDLLSNAELHSVEHLIATILRSSDKSDAVIYFGPMGCQTGFYFIADGRKLDDAGVLELLTKAFTDAAEFAGEMPGASEKECGNYRNLSLDDGRRVCARYVAVLETLTAEDMRY